MSAINTINIEKLLRLIGTANCPTIVDVRSGVGDGLIPGSVQREAGAVAGWAVELAGKSAVVVCRDGLDASPGVAAWLRHAGVVAEVLSGGAETWSAARLPLVPLGRLPPRDAQGSTVWVTRARPKVDRIACPWLIRRFVDPGAVFLYVAPGEVLDVAGRFGAAPFDIEGEGVVWSHRGGRCTFDVMVDELGLGGFEALKRLAVIVRGADTGHPELAPEAAGLLALSLGLSRMYADDLEQLEAGMGLYDALYRWCRDATGETHDWASHKPGKTSR